MRGLHAQVTADQNFHVGFNRIYDKSLAAALRKIFKSHKDLFYNTGKPFNPELAANCQSIRDFDDAVTRVSFNWPSVDAYYQGSGSDQSIPDVAIPLLCIQVSLSCPSVCSILQACDSGPLSGYTMRNGREACAGCPRWCSCFYDRNEHCAVPTPPDACNLCRRIA